MIVLLAVLGALGIGLLIGLTWRGFVMFGDRRQLQIMTQQLETEHRISMATNAAIARMRGIAMDHFRSRSE